MISAIAEIEEEKQEELVNTTEIELDHKDREINFISSIVGVDLSGNVNTAEIGFSSFTDVWQYPATPYLVFTKSIGAKREKQKAKPSIHIIEYELNTQARVYPRIGKTYTMEVIDKVKASFKPFGLTPE